MRFSNVEQCQTKSVYHETHKNIRSYIYFTQGGDFQTDHIDLLHFGVRGAKLLGV